MRKVVLAVAVISAMVFASCSNQSNTSVSTTDSTSVDSLNMFMDSLEMVPFDTTMVVDSIN